MPKHDDGDETKTSWSKCVMTGNAGSVLWMAPEVMSNFYGQGAEYKGSVDGGVRCCVVGTRQSSSTLA